ncbi:MAG: ABC transporter substrate-binding protein [Chloroflexota bacterium]
MLGRMRRVTTIGIGAVTLSACIVLGGWGPNATSASPASGAGTQAKTHKKLTSIYFILNWLPNTEFAGLWVAQQKGWFQHAGFKLGFKPWANGVFPETQVPERGGDTFGFQSGAAIAIAASRGAPDVAVYTDTQHSVFALTVMAKSKIHKLTDLKGKRIGFQSHEFYVPATMMADVGISQSEWHPVTVGFDTSELTSGHVDAYLTFLTNEPIALRLAGVKTRSFPAANYGFHFYDDVMFTTSNLIKSNPGLVHKVVKVVARGFAWAHEHPAAAAKLVVKHYFPAPKGTKAALNLRQQVLESEALAKSANTGGHTFKGTMTKSYWQDSINTLSKYHEITKKPSVNSIFTNRFNPYK